MAYLLTHIWMASPRVQKEGRRCVYIPLHNWNINTFIYINTTKSNRNISSKTHYTVTIILKINSRMDIHSMILVGFDFVAQCLPCRTGTVGFHNLKRFLLRYQQPLLIHPFMHRWITFWTYVAHLACVTYFVDHNFVDIAFLIKVESPDILPVTLHLTRILRPVATVKEVFLYVIDGHLGITARLSWPTRFQVRYVRNVVCT